MGCSPWGLQGLRHDLVTKPRERCFSEVTRSSLYPFGSFSGLFSEAAKAQVRRSVTGQLQTEKRSPWPPSCWVFTRSRPRGRGWRSCFYFSNGSCVKNVRYIRSKGRCTNARWLKCLWKRDVTPRPGLVPFCLWPARCPHAGQAWWDGSCCCRSSWPPVSGADEVLSFWQTLTTELLDSWKTGRQAQKHWGLSVALSCAGEAASEWGGVPGWLNSPQSPISADALNLCKWAQYCWLPVHGYNHGWRPPGLFSRSRIPEMLFTLDTISLGQQGSATSQEPGALTTDTSASTSRPLTAARWLNQACIWVWFGSLCFFFPPS